MTSCIFFTFAVIAGIIAIEKLVQWFPRRYEPEQISDETINKYE